MKPTLPQRNTSLTHINPNTARFLRTALMFCDDRPKAEDLEQI